MQIVDFNSDKLNQHLKVLDEAIGSLPMSKNKSFDPIAILRFLNNVTGKPESYFKLLEHGGQIVGHLIASKESNPLTTDDPYWVEHNWYVTSNLSTYLRSKGMLMLLDDFLNQTSGRFVFAIPPDNLSLSRVLKNKGFAPTELYFERID